MNAVIRKALVRGGLEITALFHALGAATAGRGLIFTLHQVMPEREQDFCPNAHLAVTPQFLDEAIREALRCGHEPVRLEDIPQRLAYHDDDRRFVAFTLDDGYRNNAEHAAPVFRRHGVPYTIFIAKGLTARTHTLWWETAEALTRAANGFVFDFGNGRELVGCTTPADKLTAYLRLAAFVGAREEDEAVARIDDAALAQGVDPHAIVADRIMGANELAVLARDPLCSLGAHTVTHCNLARVSPERLRQEIAESIDAVEAWSGTRPPSFAYPYGWKNAAGQREAKAVADAGIALAVTTQPGVLDASHLDRLTALPRVSLNGLYQKPRYVRALMSGLPFRFVA